MEYQQADTLLPDTGTRPDTSSGGGVGVVVWWHIVGLSINTSCWLVSRSTTKLGRLFWWGGAGGLLFVNYIVDASIFDAAHPVGVCGVFFDDLFVLCGV